MSANLAGAFLTASRSGRGHVCRHAESFDVVFGYQKSLEPGRIILLKRGQQLLAHFLGRDRFPEFDMAVARLVDAPFHAAGVEPAILIRFADKGGIDFSVNLRAVLVIRPDIDFAVVVAVEEDAQREAGFVAQDPAAAGAAFERIDLTACLGIRRRNGVIDAVLPGLVDEHLLNRRHALARPATAPIRQPTAKK